MSGVVLKSTTSMVKSLYVRGSTELDCVILIKVQHDTIEIWKLTLSWSILTRFSSSLVSITSAQLHSTKPKIRLTAGSNPARDVSEIRDIEDLEQCSLLEIRLNPFCCSNVSLKQFIIIIIFIMCKVLLSHWKKIIIKKENRCLVKFRNTSRTYVRAAVRLIRISLLLFRT